MPDLSQGRVEPGTGRLDLNNPLLARPSQPEPQQVVPNLRAVSGRNIGRGVGLFRGTESDGGSFVLGFKTVQTERLALVDDDATLSLRLLVPLRPRLIDYPDVEPFYRHGPWVGGANLLTPLQEPTPGNLILTRSNGSFVWREQAGRVEAVEVVGAIPQVVVAPNQITDAGTFRLSLATISVAGTYASPDLTVTDTGFITGTPAPRSLGEANTGSNLGLGVPVFVSKSGTSLLFRSVFSPSGRIEVHEQSDGILLDLPERETDGVYDFPTIVVGSDGLLEEITHRSLVGQGISVQRAGDVVRIGVQPPTYVAAFSNANVVTSMGRLDLWSTGRGTLVQQGRTARVTVDPYPVVAAANIGNGAPFVVNTVGTLTFRPMVGANGMGVVISGSQIVISGNDPTFPVGNRDIRILRLKHARVENAGTHWRIQPSVVPTPVTAGTGVPISAGVSGGTLGLRSLTAQGALAFVGDTTTLARPRLRISEDGGGAVLGVLSPLRFSGSVTLTQVAPGNIRIDGGDTTYPIQGIAAPGTLGSSPLTLATPGRFRVLSAAQGINITQGNAVTISTVGIVASGTVVSVAYDTGANRYTVSAPFFPTTEALDGAGSLGFGTTSTTQQYEVLTPGSLVPTNSTYFRRWRSTGPLTIAPGGASGPSSVANDLILSAPQLDAINLPSGIVPGSYNVRSLAVNARGLITSVQTGGATLPTFSNAGGEGEGLVVSSSPEAQFRRFGFAAPIEMPAELGGSLSATIVAAMATINVASLVQGAIAVDQKGRVTGRGAPATVAYPAGMKLWQVILSAGEVIVQGPGVTSSYALRNVGTNNEFWIFDVITLNFPSRVLSVSLYNRRVADQTHSLRAPKGSFASNFVGVQQFGPFVAPQGHQRQSGSPATVSVLPGYSASLRNSGTSLDLMGSIWLNQAGRLTGDPGINRLVCTVMTL